MRAVNKLSYREISEIMNRKAGSKLTKAIELGVKVISEDEFEEIIGK